MRRNDCVRVLFVATALAGIGGAGCNKQFDKPMKLGDGTEVSAEVLNRGREVYELNCMPCHGDKGDGNGVSAPGLRPPPRDFTHGLFKFGGVAIPSLPPDAEMKRIVRGGLHGTAMLPWDITDNEMHALVQYIKTFAPHKWSQEKPGTPIEISADPYGAAKKAEAIELGKKLYHAKAQCSGCHPSYVTHEELHNITKEMTGTGQTDFSAEMYLSQVKETEYCLKWRPAAPPAETQEARVKWFESRECAQPVKVKPPDFTRDPLRNVRMEHHKTPLREAGDEKVTEETTMRDLYRTLAAGIGGANMPTWKGALKEEEIWGLVYYVRSLIALNDPKNPGALKELRAKLDAPANMSWVPPAAAPPPAAPGTAPAGAPTGQAPTGATGQQPTAPAASPSDKGAPPAAPTPAK